MDDKIILDRINVLLENPRLGGEDMAGRKSYVSNCHGTVVYTLGLEDKFRKMTKKQDDFLSVDGRPAYTNRDLMMEFLEKHCKKLEGNYIFGDIVVLWSMIHRDLPLPELLKSQPIKTIEHSAILVEPRTGRIFHEPDTFHPDACNDFEFNTLDNYIAEWFPSFRKRGTNLFVDFYRYKD